MAGAAAGVGPGHLAPGGVGGDAADGWEPRRAGSVRPRRPGSAGLSPRVGGGSLHWTQVPHTKETNQAASGVRKAERGASARLTAERGHQASVFGLELARPAPLALCGHGMRLGLETGLRRGLSWVSTLLAANLGPFRPPQLHEPVLPLELISCRLWLSPPLSLSLSLITCVCKKHM